MDEFYGLLKQIWDKRWITNNGDFHKKLESALCDYLKVPYLSLFTNGTLPLITALQALRITGEVITTPYSFVATTHALWWNGIKPVFVDVDPITGNMDHSKIKAKSPQTNGICERFNRTVQNEFYAIAFRKKIYTSIEQLQADLDTWMNSYNTQRTHSGKYCFGKTPMQTFLEGMEVARRYQLQDAGKIQPDEQVIGSPGCESENSCVSSQMASDTFFVR